MSNKPFQQLDIEWSMMPNSLFDIIMGRCSGAEWKLICAIYRKTRGWGKKTDLISLSQLQKITGLARSTAVVGLTNLLEKNYITKKEHGRGFKYGLNADYEITDSPKIIPLDSPKIEPLDSPKIEHTKDTVKYNVKEGEASLKSTDQKQPAKDLFAMAFILSEITGMSLQPNKGRLFKAAKTLYKDDRVTPDKILQDYSPGGAWYQYDWRGRKGERPTLGNITMTVCSWDDLAAAENTIQINLKER